MFQLPEIVIIVPTKDSLSSIQILYNIRFYFNQTKVQTFIAINKFYQTSTNFYLSSLSLYMSDPFR